MNFAPESANPLCPSQPGDGPLRVLLWAPQGGGGRYGGPGMAAYRMYRHADPDRMRVTLAHGRPDQTEFPDVFARTVLIAPFDSGPTGQLRFLRAARRWIREHAGEFDVMHGLQAFMMTVLPAVWAQEAGLPAVVKVVAHRSDLADKPTIWGRLGVYRRRRRLAAGLGGLIAISEAIEEELLGYGFSPDRVFRIPNGVDTALFRPPDTAEERAGLRRRLGLPDRPTLVFSGGLFERKRPSVLVQAIGELERRGRDAQLVLVGPPADEAEGQRVAAAAAALADGSRVIRTGYVGNPQDYLRAGDAFALISRSEGMPNALLEAMASGLPSVASRISGTTDLIVEGEHGHLVDAEAGAAPIADLLEAMLFADPGLGRRMGEAARRRVVAEFSATAVLARHEALFRKLVGARR